MNKLVVAFASLLSLTALACGSQSSEQETEEETQDVTVDTESSIEPQTLCRQRILCGSNRYTYGSVESCKSSCAGPCINLGTCCSKYCPIR